MVPSQAVGVHQVAAGRFRLIRPRLWSLWSGRRRVVGYVLAVDLLAVAIVLFSLHRTPVQVTDLRFFAILLVYCLCYGEVSRRIERTYRRDAHKPRYNLDSVWMFAAALLLHPALTAVLVAVFYLYRWGRVSHRIVHKFTFGAAGGICSAAAATGFLALVGRYHGFAGLPRNATGFGLLAVTAGVFMLVNLAIMAGAFLLWNPATSLRIAVGDWSDNWLEGATVLLGGMLAWALIDWPVMAVSVGVVAYVLHSTLLINQLRMAASTDAKTGLLNTAAWYEAARRELDRARRQRAPVGVMIIDLDHFKRVNDGYGHLAGDEVLVAVAESIAAHVRAHDVVGRFGGEEFVVVLPDLDSAGAVGVAERVRAGISGLALRVTGLHGPVPLTGLTASVGVAAFPRHGDGVEALLRAADEALLAAKSGGRDQVRLASATTGSSRTLG